MAAIFNVLLLSLVLLGPLSDIRCLIHVQETCTSVVLMSFQLSLRLIFTSLLQTSFFWWGGGGTRNSLSSSAGLLAVHMPEVFGDLLSAFPPPQAL